MMFFGKIVDFLQFLFVVFDALLKGGSIDLAYNRFDVFFNIHLHHLDLVERCFDHFFFSLFLVILVYFFEEFSAFRPLNSEYLFDSIHCFFKVF
jgi:hypothetical protein